MALRLRERYYTSVADFSRDISTVIGNVLTASEHGEDHSHVDIEAIHNQLHEVKPGTAEHLALSNEQKELKKLAKRIVKAVKEPLEEAMRKEADMSSREHDEELRKLDSMNIFTSDRVAEIDETNLTKLSLKDRTASDASAAGGASITADTYDHDPDEHTDEAVIHLNIAGNNDTVPIPNNKHTPASKTTSCASSSHNPTTKTLSSKPTEPLSPPISTDLSAAPTLPAALSSCDPHNVFAHGGVPWYLAPFDPIGTTVHDERYTGRAVLRDMSEELSDMDEDTLTELATTGIDATPTGKEPSSDGIIAVAPAPLTPSGRKRAASKSNAKKKRRR